MLWGSYGVDKINKLNCLIPAFYKSNCLAPQSQSSLSLLVNQTWPDRSCKELPSYVSVSHWNPSHIALALFGYSTVQGIPCARFLVATEFSQFCPGGVQHTLVWYFTLFITRHFRILTLLSDCQRLLWGVSSCQPASAFLSALHTGFCCRNSIWLPFQRSPLKGPNFHAILAFKGDSAHNRWSLPEHLALKSQKASL